MTETMNVKIVLKNLKTHSMRSNSLLKNCPWTSLISSECRKNMFLNKFKF